MSYWTVAQTKPQREQTAAHYLTKYGFTTYLPRIQNHMKEIEPLFPCYLFVLIETQWTAINATIGVLRVLTSCDRPVVLADDIVDEIRSRENPAGLVRLPSRFELQRGSRVCITRGAFAEHFGVCHGRTGKDRVRVLLSLLGRVVPVEVPLRYLQLAQI